MAIDSDEAADGFWRYSLAVYAAPGVAAALIGLQDNAGRDVNLALFCAWVGASGRGRLTTADIERVDGAISGWRHGVIVPLRAARRAIRQDDGADTPELYDQAKALELAAERVAQYRLAGLAPAVGKRSAATRASDTIANLALYLGEVPTVLAAAVESIAG